MLDADDVVRWSHTSNVVQCSVIVLYYECYIRSIEMSCFSVANFPYGQVAERTKIVAKHTGELARALLAKVQSVRLGGMARVR